MIVLLNNSGNFIWSEETKPIATFGANKSRVTLNTPRNGQLVTTFIENKTGSNQIFAQNFIDTELLSTTNFSTNLIQFTNPIVTELSITSNSQIKSISIYSILGELISQYKSINNNNFTINAEHWNSGLYLMTLTTKNGALISKKVLKK